MEIQKKVLDNGLTTVIVPMEDTPTVTVMVMVGVGSRFEEREENGISHFLEHMFFKGTENRPSSHKVSTKLDSLGAESNAFTGHEYTAYYGKAQADKTNQILDILADIYQNSLFPKEEIEKEAGVITEEIRMYNDLPMRLVQDIFQEHMYPKHPMGRMILGTKENVNSFKRDDFLNYEDTHYNAENTAVIIAGGVSTDEAHEEIEEQFRDISTKDAESPQPAEPQPESRITYQQRDSDQTHLVVGAPAVERESNKLSETEVLSTVLGRGMSSRLFKKLRDEMGVCYYVKSSADYFTDTGLFKVSTGVTPSRLQEVIKAITEEIHVIAEEGIEKDELEKAQEFVAGNFLLNHETTDQIARDLAKQAVLDESMEAPQEYTQKLHKVTSAEVQNMAQEVIDNGLHAAVIGPECDKTKLHDTLTN